MTGVLIRRINLDRHIWREDHMKRREEMAIYKPRREASEETKPTDTLISDFKPPKL